MKRFLPALLLLALFPVARADTPAPAAPNAPAADSVLYQDDAGSSSASVTQVYPNSSTSMQTMEHVKRVSIRQNVLVIEWAGAAVTLLPCQYVASLTLNKRADLAAPTAPAAAPAATAPATPPSAHR